MGGAVRVSADLVKGMGVLKRLVPAVLAALLAGWAPLGAQVVIEQVLVNVNGDIVTLSEFEERQVAMLRDRPELAKVSPNSPEFLRAVADMVPQLILAAVDDLLWIQRAREHGWALTPQKLDEIILTIRKNNNMEDDAAFKRALQAEGLTVEKLRHDLEQRALIDEAQRADVLEKIEVNETEILAFYEANRPRFTRPSEIMIREILIASDGQADARGKAEAVRARLAAGEPFPQLASELSASSTKAVGGLIGPIRLEELDKRLQDVFGAMRAGDISQVMETRSGFQIFKLESRTDVSVQPLEDVRGEISRRLQDQKKAGEMVKYLETLRARAKITWRHDELKKAYDYALTQRLERAGLTPAALTPAAPAPAARKS